MSVHVLLLDASLAGCAGSRASVGDSRTVRCRAVLSSIQRSTCEIGFTRESFEEWRRHRGAFAYSWLTSMYARRRVRLLKSPPSHALLRKAAGREFAAEPDLQRKFAKDLHLIEAALAHDRRVISDDARMRQHLRRLCKAVGELSRVHWVCPPDEKALEWIEAGSPDEPGFCICSST
jgi:hypothetical protein